MEGYPVYSTKKVSIYDIWTFSRNGGEDGWRAVFLPKRFANGLDEDDIGVLNIPGVYIIRCNGVTGNRPNVVITN